MFEYYGWVSLRNDPHNIDGPNLTKFLPELEAKVQEFTYSEIVLKETNGGYKLWLTGHPNHRQNWVFEFFEFIAPRAPGSYGLLYVWDDEHPEYDNEFRVWRMLRGRVEEISDPFLSPCVPTIEDPYNRNKEIDW